ncbi:glycosyltransferase family 2 protein [Rhodococcoides kyotonense]|uniref:Glycosyltransferase, GT2 family n=1 Tax=Rhodococcoides kyotonense TaxID=398843 RepID=A0A239MJ76_9NOCA|nr:galactosyltransferase-related protein [Rhodococcus kyotonensis]SNT42144.1 Glycosyltransferase, GT2 family [Rhodococcus kyotonensis]
MKISVITVVSGRHDHLAGQLHGLAESSVSPWQHVVVAMGDSDIACVVRESGSDATVVDIDAPRPQLPLAHARNIGASVASNAGADLLVFLDVDCIPGTDLLRHYESAAVAGALLCGPVTYLPPRHENWTTAELHAATRPHPARPDPEPGVVEDGTDYDLFWSLSFAVTPATWSTIGGFYEGYSGYGGEDTDFAATARSAGIGLRWVGGAHAYHQYHPVSSPPVEHLDDIVRNSTLFHRRWSRWPMEGWLSEFERRGLITRTARGTIARNPIEDEIED